MLHHKSFVIFWQAIKEGKDLEVLAKQQDLEREVLENKYTAEQSEQTAEIIKKLNNEYKVAVRKGHQNFLNEVKKFSCVL